MNLNRSITDFGANRAQTKVGGGGPSERKQVSFADKRERTDMFELASIEKLKKTA